MSKSKRSDKTIEEVVAAISPKWEKAKNLREILNRAKEGIDLLCSKRSIKLNDIWNLFYKYPEVFLVREYLTKINDEYMSSCYNSLTNANLQIENMEAAINIIQLAVESIYGNISIEVEKDILRKAYRCNHNGEIEEVVEFKSLFENDNENLVKKASIKSLRLTKELQKDFENDITPITFFGSSRGNLLIKYLTEVAGVKTLGDFMSMSGNKKRANAFYQKASSVKEEYFDFKNKLNIYIRSIMEFKIVKNDVVKKTNKVIDSKSTEKKVVAKPELTKTGAEKKLKSKQSGENAQLSLKPSKRSLSSASVTTEHSDFNSNNANGKFSDSSTCTEIETRHEKIDDIKDLESIEACKFKKDSKQMARISTMVKELLNNLTEQYLDVGLSEEEIKLEIESQIEYFHRIVDMKRAQLDRERTASMIRSIIDGGVKYKYKPQKSILHKHNMFVDDDLNI